MHKFLDCLLVIIIFVIFAEDTESQVCLVAVFDSKKVQKSKDVTTPLLVLLPFHYVEDISYSCNVQLIFQNKVINVLDYQRYCVLRVKSGSVNNQDILPKYIMETIAFVNLAV